MFCFDLSVDVSPCFIGTLLWFSWVSGRYGGRNGRNIFLAASEVGI